MMEKERLILAFQLADALCLTVSDRPEYGMAYEIRHRLYKELEHDVNFISTKQYLEVQNALQSPR